MVTKRMPVVHCDRCGRSRDDTKKLTLIDHSAGVRGRQVTFDACAECRKEATLTEWLDLIPRKTHGTRVPTVVSSDAVENAANRQRGIVKRSTRR